MELTLNKSKYCRQVTQELGRAPSTAAGDVARHRFVTFPKAHLGSPRRSLRGLCAAGRPT